MKLNKEYVMQATKYTVKIEVETLSIDLVPALINDAVTNIIKEHTSGHVVYSEGDQVSWITITKPVEF
jgi:hypothetical protein